MAKRNIKFDLDFEQKDILSKFSIKQFDNALINISTYSEGKELNPVGNTCKLYVSVGNEVFLQNNGIRVLENTIEIDLDKNIVSSHGKALGELELTDSNGVFTSTTFIFDIDSKVGEGSTLPNGVEGFITKHERLIREFKNEINPKVEKLQSDINKSNNEINVINSELKQIERKNIEQDTRLKDVEYKNKVQDVYVKGLFNENNDKRLSIEGKGNSIKLEGSKKGLVTVDKVVGDTLVNLVNVKTPFTWKGTTRSKTLTNDISVFKPNTTYTVMFNVSNLNVGSSVNGLYVEIQCSALGRSGGSVATVTGNGTWIGTFQTFNHDDSVSVKNLIAKGATSQWTSEDTEKTMTLSDFVILEGDYTNKPIPQEYFTGLQSTFENKLITQEMVDNEEELEKNLGKYKCEVKVRGKNLFDFDTYTMENVLNSNVTVDSIDKAITMQRTNSGKYEYVEFDVNLQANTPYVLSYNIDTLVNNSKPLRRFEFVYSDGTTKAVLHGTTSFEKINEQKRIKKIRVCMEVIGSDKVILSKIQIEGDTQTSYEPYYERKAMVYLNSPLLKGDEIVCKEDGLYHYHKMGKVVLDGSDDEKWGMPNSQPDNTSRFYWLNIAPGGVNGANTICDKSPTKSGAMADMLGIWVDANIILNVPKTVTTIDECKLLLSSNPITVVYELAEPYFEKIIDDKLLLEIPNSATLSVESVIPCQGISATYTGGIPSVYGLEETGIANTNDIAVTQTAVDFLLMSSMGEIMMMSFKNNTKGGNNMGAYFASRIIKKALKYEDVIRKYPEFKEDIDFILRSEGYGDLIVEVQ